VKERAGVAAPLESQIGIRLSPYPPFLLPVYFLVQIDIGMLL
jgi:hypothetical protein